jgi:hypothetical protein
MFGQDPLTGRASCLSVSVLHLLSPRSELAKNKEDNNKIKAHTNEKELMSAFSMVHNDICIYRMPSIYISDSPQK